MYLILAWMTMIMVIRGGDEYTVRCFSNRVVYIVPVRGGKEA
jgi:hypothetical protein